MPKFKPNKGLLKRVRVTGRNKVKFKRSGKSHLNSAMSQKRTRNCRRPRMASRADAGRLEQLLGVHVVGSDRK